MTTRRAHLNTIPAQHDISSPRNASVEYHRICVSCASASRRNPHRQIRPAHHRSDRGDAESLQPKADNLIGECGASWRGMWIESQLPPDWHLPSQGQILSQGLSQAFASDLGYFNLEGEVHGPGDSTKRMRPPGMDKTLSLISGADSTRIASNSVCAFLVASRYRAVAFASAFSVPDVFVRSFKSGITFVSGRAI